MHQASWYFGPNESNRNKVQPAILQRTRIRAVILIRNNNKRMKDATRLLNMEKGKMEGTKYSDNYVITQGKGWGSIREGRHRIPDPCPDNI